VRLFVAIELASEVRDAIERALQPLRALPELPRELRWLPPDSWHVTLQFLGNAEERLLADLAAACTQAVRAHAPFELVLQGAGAFSPRAARVLWLGATAGTAPIIALGNSVIDATEPLGFEREERPFAAHVTLARIKPAADVRPLLPRLQLGPFSQRVSELVLFRSHLSSTGARYEPLLRAPLG
jgi:2'-5' RNA ligase